MHIKYTLSLVLSLTVYMGLTQTLHVDYRVTDDALRKNDIGTARIELLPQGGQPPYTFHWEVESVGLDESVLKGAKEGQTYHVYIADTANNKQTLKILVPAVSFPEKINTFFTPLVDWVNTFLFADPFYSLNLYDNTIYDENGQAVLNPNGTKKTVHVPFVVIWLVIGAIFMTLRMGFVNIRGIQQAFRLVRGKFNEADAPGQVTHFQALATAVSGTVGLGNIAGVAVAIAAGGPGATFWLIVAGLLGMSTKFVECTLGVKYRTILPNGSIMGGPMNYLRRGLEARRAPIVGKILALVYAFIIIFASFAAGAMFQSNQATLQITTAMAVGDHGKFFIGLLIALLVFLVIVGGIKSIANVTDKVVPSMAGLYFIMCMTVIIMNIEHLPSAIQLIFDGAFNAEAIYGGGLGVMIQGFRRASFSNEAGLGTASIVHSTAKTKHPVSEGLVALMEPFIDTVVICTLTALVLIFSGVYNDTSVEAAALTSKAFSHAFGSFSDILLALATFLFAFSTIITWSYYGLKATTYIMGNNKWVVLGFKIIFVMTVVLGAIMGLGSIIDLADSMMLSLAIPNLIGLYLMSNEVARDLKEYFRKLKTGEIVPKK